MQGSRATSHAVRVRRLLPASVLVTAGVVVVPALAAGSLPGHPGPLVCVPVAMLLSLVLSRLGAEGWRRLPQSRDVLFADLMLWGWLRRLRTERRLEDSHSLVVPGAGAGAADPKRHVRDLERVTGMLESRDAYTHHHSLRVTRYAEAIACELGLDEPEVCRVRTAAALHDVGKYFTPREILNKPARLTEDEFAVIQRHPAEGADLVAGVVEPPVAEMILHHHERLDGSGYPAGLTGEAIPLGARIISVADTFDAITSTRTYRRARTHGRALEVMSEESGGKLDPRVVAAFSAYYTGRRGRLWSSLASGATQVLAPAREFVGPATLARVLPTLGASAALTAPLVVGGGLGAPPSAADPLAQQRARAAGQATAAAGPAATTSPSVARPAKRARGTTPPAFRQIADQRRRAQSAPTASPSKPPDGFANLRLRSPGAATPAPVTRGHGSVKPAPTARRRASTPVPASATPVPSPTAAPQAPSPDDPPSADRRPRRRQRRGRRGPDPAAGSHARGVRRDGQHRRGRRGGDRAHGPP